MNTNTNEELNKTIKILSDQINNNDKKKLLLIVPESAGDVFLVTSLFSSLKETYHEYELYFACKKQFIPLLYNNPYITKVLEYNPIMENQLIMEGTGEWKGLFDISIMATILTQRHLNYLNNGQTRISLDLRK
jgi:hypothetical protein